MTEDYVSEASDLVAQVYQESSQKQINVLQYIFVISAVASIIFLGTITGFAITLFDNSGARVLSGSTVGFSLPDLLRFGGFAIGAGTILYVVINLIYKHFANSRLSNPKLLENDEFKKIKKMLN